LALEERGFGVYEDDFVADGLEDKGVGEGGADVAAAEDGDCSFEFGLFHCHLGVKKVVCWWMRTMG
jgi:hypothetical protein